MLEKKLLLTGLCLSTSLTCLAQVCPSAVNLPARPDDVSKYLPIQEIQRIEDRTCRGGWRYENVVRASALSDAEMAEFWKKWEPAAWQSDMSYRAGDEVRHGERDYRAQWWTQGEAPPAEVWQEVHRIAGAYPWQATRAYVAGERVTFEGKEFEARWWTQGRQPAADNRVEEWRLIGDAVADSLSKTYSFTLQRESNGDLSLVGLWTDRYEVNKWVTVGSPCSMRYWQTVYGTHPSLPRVGLAPLTLYLDGKVVGTYHFSPPPAPMFRGGPPDYLPPPYPDGTCSAAPGTYSNGYSHVLWEYGGNKLTLPAGLKGHYFHAMACLGNVCRPSVMIAASLLGHGVQ